jgi:alpha-mannosidase
MDWADRKNPPFLRIEGEGQVSIIESGPIRSTLKITINYGKSLLVKEVSLAQDSKVVEFTERLHWRGLGCSFKLALTPAMDKPAATFNWESSRLQRGINNEKCYEMPSRYWTDMSENNWGISIIEDSKYGYDHPTEDTLRLTLLYTPGIRLGFRDQKWHDWGDHTIKYALYGHEGDYTTTDRIARAFNQRVRAFSIAREESTKGKKSVSLFEISNDQLGILAIKKAEDSDAVLIRLYERYGKAGQTDVVFSSEIQQVQEVNGLEESIEKITASGNKFGIKFGANQIRSFIVTLKDKSAANVIKQEVIKLDFNNKLIGANGDQQALYPSELVPLKILAGNISYQLAPEEKMNALQSNGQKIVIPEKYNTLSILSGSTTATDAVFKWVDNNGKVINEVKSHISAMTGYRGQWDRRKWLLPVLHHLRYHRDYAWINYCIGVKPGFINRDRVEWYATHTHKKGQDQPYKYGYMNTITFDIPTSAKALVLPEDKKINIFAMTVSQQNTNVKNSTPLRDKFDF